MSKKNKNKNLLIALLVLIVLFVITKYFSSYNNEQTFKTELVSIDTAKITTLLLYPQSEEGKEIKFTKQANSWTVQKDNVISEVDNNAIGSLLSTILEIKPQRLAAKSKDKWNEFQVGDSLSTRIKVMEGDITTLDIVIGKFSYKPQQNPYGMQMQGNNISGISYVRLSDEDEVYAVNGFIPMMVNQPFSSWRNKVFIDFIKKDMTKISFQYPEDSGFVLMKRDTTWMMGDNQVDSIQVDKFLNPLTSKTIASFVDNFTPSNPMLFQLLLEGNNATSVSVQCFIGNNEAEYVLHSSLNPNVYFSGQKKDMEQLFKRKEDFVSQQ